jgi:hypothetical protein
MKYKIKYGLAGGFGGANNEEIIDVETQEEAEKYAYEVCCEYYESYVGAYGLRDFDEIMEDDGVGEDEAWEIFNEERESWLEYSAEPYNEDL